MPSAGAFVTQSISNLGTIFVMYTARFLIKGRFVFGFKPSPRFFPRISPAEQACSSPLRHAMNFQPNGLVLKAAPSQIHREILRFKDIRSIDYRITQPQHVMYTATILIGGVSSGCCLVCNVTNYRTTIDTLSPMPLRKCRNTTHCHRCVPEASSSSSRGTRPLTPQAVWESCSGTVPIGTSVRSW